MNSTIAPAGRHVHLDFDVDREHRFHYRSAGRDGHRVILHRGDTITFTCEDEFSIEFREGSPFEERVLHSHHSFATCHVRRDAPYGAYDYVVEVAAADEVYTDPEPGSAPASTPAIVIERDVGRRPHHCENQALTRHKPNRTEGLE